ncbi:(d)CMP kinase [Megasphaera paucivorans]|uniref:Cytidylate kinase n=1 Tax=Megasphaera paucivorans TaxID=349095 RepID=A0A1G9TIY1_9FIRM|nr:(d)CMP kinase [Megasphaera paucivorans]SDM47075.1 cytidylate kinase [Megasphaera paucivorans]
MKEKLKKISIAIDGPAGAGKSSVAKLVANRLNYLYIDTGAMYRAFTWAVMHRNIDIADEKAVQALAETLEIRLEADVELCRVYVDGQEVTNDIRMPEVSAQVSSVAALAVVREKLVQLQKEMSMAGGVILDGRDIGTVVLPKADLKIFLTASADARAKRRWLELKNRGTVESLQQIADNIQARDKMDSHRAVSPLRQAEDAVLVDNSEISLQETAEMIVKMAEEKMR